MNTATALCLALIMTSTCCHAQASSAIDKKVVRLIARMTKSSAAEQKAFAQLEALGCAAVPAIIDHIDDRRDLPDYRISLVNKSPNAFEARRYYGPEKVVDALAAILNQLTGQDFGSIYNGATDADRSKAVAGWRKYLKETPATKLCAAG